MITSNIKEPKLPQLPIFRTEKQAKDFIKHILVISLIEGLEIHQPQHFTEACRLYRIGLN